MVSLRKLRAALGFGALLMVALVNVTPAAAGSPSFLGALGGEGVPICTTTCLSGDVGDGPGELNPAVGTAVSGTGHVYVSERSNHRVSEFTQTGAFVRAFGKNVGGGGIDVCTTSCVRGSQSSVAGALNDPAELGVSGSGDVYVADRGNNRIVEFTQQGAFVRVFAKNVGGAGVNVCTSSCGQGSFGSAAGELAGPNAVAVSASGDVYVADSTNNRISEFTGSGTFLQAFGKDVGGVGVDVCTAPCVGGNSGGGAGQLNNPAGIGVSGTSDVYVADRANQRISEFSQTGTFQRAFAKDVGGAGVNVCTSPCVAGSGGGAAAQLNDPNAVAVSGSGDVYVADQSNNRIAQFTQTGAFVRAFGKGVGGSGVDVCTSPCVAGSSGGAAGQLNDVLGVATSGSGDVYVGDVFRVAEFTQAGAFVRAVGKDVGLVPLNCTTASGCEPGLQGDAAGELNSPAGAAVSGSGDVYVADQSNNRIAQFTQTGAFVRAFGKGVGGSGIDICTSSCVAGITGAGAGELISPPGVAVSGSSGDVYVADQQNNRIAQFTQAGAFVRAFGKGVGGPGVDVCTSPCQAGSFGDSAGSLALPSGLAVSGSGDVYVADLDNSRVAQFTQSGVFVRVFGKNVGGPGVDVCTTSCQAGSVTDSAGALAFPSGVAVSGAGDVYVADTDNLRVAEFTQTGMFVRAFGKGVGGSGVDICASSCVAGTSGDGAGQFSDPVAVAASASGAVYVADASNQRIGEYTQAGVFVRVFGKGVGGGGADICVSSCMTGSSGGAAGQFDGPGGLGVGGSGDLYVADENNQRVDQFSTNAVPVAVADAYSTNENTPLTISSPATGVLGNDTDSDSDALTAGSYTDPQHGTLSHNADGTFTYTPAANFDGQDSFTYKASDVFADSGAATVTITVAAVRVPDVRVIDPAPVLSAFRFGPSAFKAKDGSRIRFTLSEAASVRVIIDRPTTGRRVGGRCRARSRGNRKRPKCTRFVRAGALTRAGASGANSSRFNARVGGRRLGTGKYRATATATDGAGQRSAAVRASFRVKPKARAR